jgi:hypothetical protein
MHSFVVNVGAGNLAGQGASTVMFLLIADAKLDARHVGILQVKG